jgi:hypothetical protein
MAERLATHYLAPTGGFIHALPDAFGACNANPDPAKVDCDVCLSILAAEPMTRPQPTGGEDVEALENVIYDVIVPLTSDHAWAEEVTEAVAQKVAAYVQAARDEELARVLGEVERDLTGLPTTRTKAWDRGWDSISLDDAIRIVREARGGAR